MNFANVKSITIPEGKVKQISIGDLILWKKSGYTNLVPTSIDTDGSVFNGTGYQEGKRLSSSGALKDQTGSVATGFIPAKRGDVIRMSGATWGTSVSSGYCYIQYYDANFKLLYTINKHMNDTVSNGISNISANVNKSASSVLTDSNGITTFNLVTTDNAEYSYIRISATGNGVGMIVTVNEEISKVEVPYTNLVPTSKDTDGSVFNGVGYRDGYRLSSSGSLSAQDGKTVSGFIPCKSTDLIRLSGVDWFPPSGNCYLVFYDSNFATLGSVNIYTDSSAASGYLAAIRGNVRFKSTTSTPMDIHPSESNGVFTFDQITFTDGSKVAYFRINGHGNGANMIVTVNEEIA